MKRLLLTLTSIIHECLLAWERLVAATASPRACNALPRRQISYAVILALITLTPTLTARANGNNQVIFLTYLPDVSNFGNQSASGIAVVDLHTGEVAVQAASLTSSAGEHYEVWLTGPNLSDPVHVASLPADGHLATVVVSGLPQIDYRYVLLTMEADDTAPAAPGDKRSLAGVFPNAEAVAEVSGVGSSGQPVTSEPPAAQLPETGALLPDSWVQVGGMTIVLLIGLAFIWDAYRREQKGNAK